MNSRQAFGKLLLALDSRLPDTELDTQASLTRQVQKRVRIVSVTAMAMIEESGAEELARHVVSLEEGKLCSCGLRFKGVDQKIQAHQEHVDDILAEITLKIAKAVKKNRAVNWQDVKDEADGWDADAQEPLQ